MRQHDSNHFEKIEVSSTVFAACSRWSFNSQSLFLFLEAEVDGGDIIEYSFSGKEEEVHGEINPIFFRGICFDNRVCDKIFFRRKESGQTVIIRVEAWR